MPNPRTSLIITTYNWPQALAVVLASVRTQSCLPDEVIVADDGSGPATRALLLEQARDFPVPLRHAWQDDSGFRAARSRNLGIAGSSGDYVLLLDGDMVLHPEFVADHLRFAAPGGFVQGSRVLISADFSARMLADPQLRPGFFAGGLRRRRHTLRSLPLARLYMRLRGSAPQMVKTCNQGWWRSDLARLNGFDERMVGWGREDDELALRAAHAGLACRQLRMAALGFHLHHPARKPASPNPNNVYIEQTLATRSQRSAHGLDAHVDTFRRHPLADLREDRAPQPRAY